MRRFIVPSASRLPPTLPQLRPHPHLTLPSSPRHNRWQAYASSTTESEGEEVKPASTEAGGSTSAASALETAMAEKDKEIARLKDNLLRAVADYDNLQKTTAREKVNAKEFAIQNFARDLVSDLDVLTLALASVKPESRQSQPDLQELWTGVEMTKSEVEHTLKRYGITPFDPTGHRFDPNLHEALYQAPVPGKEAGTVLECQKLGWMFKDRLLRPAQVGVVFEPSS